MEKLDRAREDGNYLDLTSSQGEVETITTPERPKRDEPSNPPKSFLACHARETPPGAPHRRRGRVAPRGVSRTPRHTPRGGRGDARVRRRVDDRRSRREFDAESDPESEPESESGDCVRDGTGIRKTSAGVAFANSSRTSSRRVPLETPSRSARTSLWWCSFSRLVAAAVSAAAASSANDAVSLDRAAAAALRPVLDAVVRLIQSNGEGEDDRLSRSCGIQILGALAMRGTIDLGAPVPLVRHAGVDASPGVPRGRAVRRGVGVRGNGGMPDAAGGHHGATVTLRRGVPPRRRLSAARRGGVETRRGVRTRRRRGRYGRGYGRRGRGRRVRRGRGRRARPPRRSRSRDGTSVGARATPPSSQTLRPGSPRRVRHRRRANCAAPPRVFIRRRRRARRAASPLALRVHGEPRFVALSALCLAARSDSAAGAAFAERALPELGVILSARDPQVHALTLKTLAAILPSLKEEASRWPHGKRVDVERWRDAATRVESALWNAADASVREAHAEMCAALADAAPALREHPAVRAPLLRARSRTRAANPRAPSRTGTKRFRAEDATKASPPVRTRRLEDATKASPPPGTSEGDFAPRFGCSPRRPRLPPPPPQPPAGSRRRVASSSPSRKPKTRFTRLCARMIWRVANSAKPSSTPRGRARRFPWRRSSPRRRARAVFPGAPPPPESPPGWRRATRRKPRRAFPRKPRRTFPRKPRRAFPRRADDSGISARASRARARVRVGDARAERRRRRDVHDARIRGDALGRDGTRRGIRGDPGGASSLASPIGDGDAGWRRRHLRRAGEYVGFETREATRRRRIEHRDRIRTFRC